LDFGGASPLVALPSGRVGSNGRSSLTAALNSPVRHEMREDYKSFPPFTGPVSHYPMSTAAILPP
jgi:hypothetical protein